MGDDGWRKHPTWPKWIFQSWVRDWLIGPVCVVAAWIYGVHNLWALAVIPLMAGALSAYWGRLFGHDNFYFHGLIVGLAAFPIAIITGHWWPFFLRALILSVLMGFWSEITDNDDLEEFGRYLPVGLTIFYIC